MIAIDPITINDTTLISSSVPETDAPAWSSATTYALNALVIVPSTHEVYQSLSNTNINQNPLSEIQGDPANPPVWWLLLGKTNRYRMFDEVTSTQTSKADEITFTVGIAERFAALSLLNLDARQVIVTVEAGGLEVYNKTFDLINSDAESTYYAYFFEPLNFATELTVLDLPNFANSEITVQILNTGFTARCGLCVIGRQDEMGISNNGLTVDLIDYSLIRREFDGSVTLRKRASSKIMNVNFYVPKELCAVTLKKLDDLRGRPVLYLGAQDRGSTYVYGIATRVREAIPFENESLYEMTVEGLI